MDSTEHVQMLDKKNAKSMACKYFRLEKEDATFMCSAVCISHSQFGATKLKNKAHYR